MKILLIEDQKKLAESLKKGLQREKMTVDLAFTAREGLTLIRRNKYDLILLDVMLPDKSGVEVCQDLRAKGDQTFIIMLTARSRMEDKLKGLSVGADDYLTKPFNFDELLWRIKNILQRRHPHKIKKLSLGDIELNLTTRESYLASDKLKLSNTEFKILEYMMRDPGRVVSREELLDNVWDVEYDSFSNIVDVYINYLRKKIKKPDQNTFIKTIKGVGYKVVCIYE